MAFEIPSDLNPALVGLAWLRGRWEGTGYRQWPGLEKHSYALQVDFADNGEDYLHYLCQAFETDAEGAAYEVHLQKSDGSLVTVKLDASFTVTSVEQGPA